MVDNQSPDFQPPLASVGGRRLDPLSCAADVSFGQVVHRLWSKDLTAVGLLFVASTWATMMSSPLGNTVLQVQVIAITGVVAIPASTGFFATLVDTLIKRYGRECGGVSTALSGGEKYDCAAKHRRIESTNRVSTRATNAAADLGPFASGGAGSTADPWFGHRITGGTIHDRRTHLHEPERLDR